MGSRTLSLGMLVSIVSATLIYSSLACTLLNFAAGKKLCNNALLPGLLYMYNFYIVLERMRSYNHEDNNMKIC